MKPNSYLKEVKTWYEFGALASVYTTSASFPEISALLKWIQEVVPETWATNDYLSMVDILKLYFFSAAPEPVEKSSHEAFHSSDLGDQTWTSKSSLKSTRKWNTFCFIFYRRWYFHSKSVRILGLCYRYEQSQVSIHVLPKLCEWIFSVKCHE